MTAARKQTTPDRTREILEDLEAVRENLRGHRGPLLRNGNLMGETRVRWHAVWRLRSGNATANHCDARTGLPSAERRATLT